MPAAPTPPRHLFIMGCARTGSNLHREVLGAHPDVVLLNELHYLVPRWIREDFRRAAARLGQLRDAAAVDRLLELMHGGTLTGVFWRPADDGLSGLRVGHLDRDRLRARILASDRSLRAILRCVLDGAADRDGARISGAKGPMDIAYLPTLLDWFPDSAVVHTVRDPRAIYASMVAADLRLRRDRSPAAAGAIRAARLAYVVARYRVSARMHRRYRDHPRVVLSRYEDLVRDPERQVAGLCEAIGLEPDPAMLTPHRGRSSYQDRPRTLAGAGFEARAADRWRGRIHPATGRALGLALARSRRTLGYR